MNFYQAQEALISSNTPKVAVRKIWLSNKYLRFVYYVSPQTISIDKLRNEAHNIISQLDDMKPTQIDIRGHFDLYCDGHIQTNHNFTQMEINDPQWLVLSIGELLELFKAQYKEDDDGSHK